MKSDEETTTATAGSGKDTSANNDESDTSPNIKSPVPFSPPTNSSSTDSTQQPPQSTTSTENNNNNKPEDDKNNIDENIKSTETNNINGHKEEDIEKKETNGVSNEKDKDKEKENENEIENEKEKEEDDEEGEEEEGLKTEKESPSNTTTEGINEEESQKNSSDKMDVDNNKNDDDNNNLDKEKLETPTNNEDNRKEPDDDVKMDKDESLDTITTTTTTTTTKTNDDDNDNNNNNNSNGNDDGDGIVEIDTKQIEEELAKNRKENSLSPNGNISNGSNGNTTTTTTTIKEQNEDEEMEDSEYELLKDKNIIENNLVAKSSYNSNREEDIEQRKRLECLSNIEKIEKEFTVLKEKFFKEKLEQIKKEVEDIKIGEHQTLQERLRDLESKKEKKLQIAETWKNYQLQSIMHMFESEKQQYEDEHLEETTHLKDRMVNSLQDKQKRIAEERDSMRSDGDNRINTRIRRRPPAQQQQQQQPPNSKKKQTPHQISYSLKENEIQEDFNIIFNNSSGILKSRR